MPGILAVNVRVVVIDLRQLLVVHHQLLGREQQGVGTDVREPRYRAGVRADRLRDQRRLRHAQALSLDQDPPRGVGPAPILRGEDPPRGEKWRTGCHLAGLDPRPQLPIYLAALSPAMLRLAGEIAGGGAEPQPGGNKPRLTWSDRSGILAALLLSCGPRASQE